MFEMKKVADFWEAAFFTSRPTGQISYARSTSFPQSAQSQSTVPVGFQLQYDTIAEVERVLVPTMDVSSNNADAHPLFTFPSLWLTVY